jgi:hypothetical protein
MTDLFKLILGILASRFKARATLEAENPVLRQQVNVLRRRTPKRPHLTNTDRFLFVWLYRWFPSVLEVVAIVLCLSKIISGHIGGVARRGLGGKECARLVRRRARSAHLSPGIDACGPHCNISCNRAAGDGGGVR